MGLFKSILIKASDSERYDIDTKLIRGNKGVINGSADIDIDERYGRNLNLPGEYENCWAQIGSDLDGEAPYDSFGVSVGLTSVAVNGSLENMTLAVGALGYAEVFKYTSSDGTIYDGEWTQVGDKMTSQDKNLEFGKVISLSSNGHIVAVSAPFHAVNEVQFVGHVRIYSQNTVSGIPTWMQLGQDLEGYERGEQFGNSLELSGDGHTVIIGTNVVPTSSTPMAPITRIFRYDETTNTWNLLGTEIVGSVPDRSDKATSISYDGNVIAIGSQHGGVTRIFQLNDVTETWDQLGNSIEGEATGDKSGGSVSLSYNGTIVAVGAERNTGDNKSASGHVRVYIFNSATVKWDQRGQDIDGEYATDFSGSSVSLSDDGSIVAIGAWSNDGFGVNAGHVRVYRFESSEWKIYGQDLDGASGGDAAGRQLSLSPDGQVVAIGSRGHETYTGHVRIFANTNERCMITSPPSSQPTLAPSQYPSAVPSESKLPSRSPSTFPSTLPSTSSSTFPSALPVLPTPEVTEDPEIFMDNDITTERVVEDENLSPGAIAGIVVGSVAAVGIGFFTYFQRDR